MLLCRQQINSPLIKTSQQIFDYPICKTCHSVNLVWQILSILLNAKINTSSVIKPQLFLEFVQPFQMTLCYFFDVKP